MPMEPEKRLVIRLDLHEDSVRVSRSEMMRGSIPKRRDSMSKITRARAMLIRGWKGRLREAERN